MMRRGKKEGNRMERRRKGLANQVGEADQTSSSENNSVGHEGGEIVCDSKSP